MLASFDINVSNITHENSINNNIGEAKDNFSTIINIDTDNNSNTLSHIDMDNMINTVSNIDDQKRFQ